VGEFLEEARAAFRDGKDDAGVAYLSAALVAEPANADALNLYEERLRNHFEEAIRSRDWELAQVHVAGYDSAVRAGLKGVRTKAQVQDLLERQRKLAAWETSLREKRDQFACEEVSAVLEKLDTDDRAELHILEIRLKKLPLAVLGTEARAQLASAALRLRERDFSAETKGLARDYEQLSSEARKEGLQARDLRQLSVRAQNLRTRVIEAKVANPDVIRFTPSQAARLPASSAAKLAGPDIVRMEADCDGLLAELEQRIQVLSIRKMQQVADGDAVWVLKRVDAILQEIDKATESKCQWRGEKLAEGEALLFRIDRLCSEEMQTESRKRQEDIRKRAVKYRVQQQALYNAWAIDVLEQAMKEHSAATPWYWLKDRGKLKEIISDRLGEIDSQHLHPVTHALFTELFQKILNGLGDNNLKIEVTKNVEQKEKKALSDF
jgi:hypothetical protein